MLKCDKKVDIYACDKFYDGIDNIIPLSIIALSARHDEVIVGLLNQVAPTRHIYNTYFINKTVYHDKVCYVYLRNLVKTSNGYLFYVVFWDLSTNAKYNFELEIESLVNKCNGRCTRMTFLHVCECIVEKKIFQHNPRRCFDLLEKIVHFVWQQIDNFNLVISYDNVMYIVKNIDSCIVSGKFIYTLMCCMRFHLTNIKRLQ